MGDSKFVIVTTLCYVGIFGVVFIVCCCAWTRHLRKSSRGLSSQQRNTQTNRRYLYRPTPQPPEYNAPSTPMPYGPSWPRRGEIQNVNANYFPAASQRAVAGPMFPGYPSANLYSFGVTSAEHVVEIATFGRDNRHGEQFAGNDLSHASNFDQGDSTFVDTEDRTRVLTRSQSSLESEKEVESDSDGSSSQPSHLQDVTLREEGCV